MMTMKKLFGVIGLSTIMCALAGCDVDVKDPGELPEVDVQGPDVDVSTEQERVTVPDIDVGTEEAVMTVPDVDVEVPEE